MALRRRYVTASRTGSLRAITLPASGALGRSLRVPKGTEHKPSSPSGSILMFEPFGTLMAGDGHHDGIPVSIDSTAGRDISE